MQLVTDWEAQYSGAANNVPSSSNTTPQKGQNTSNNRSNSAKREATPIKPRATAEEEPATTRLFRIAEELESMAPGLFPETDANRRDWVAWRIRVWRYLAYCADGVLYKEAVNFEQLCKAWKSPATDKDIRFTVGRVLDKFIHLRQAGEEYKPDELAQKASSERLMSSCTFHERVMAKLLKKDNGYIQGALSAYDAYLYPKFLVRLLVRSDEASGVAPTSEWLNDSFGGAQSDAYDPCEPISHAVLKTLVVQSSTITPSSSSSSSSVSKEEEQEKGSSATSNASSSSNAYDISLNILVPALIRVFMNHPEDDKLKTFVVAILVNFSRNNYSVKANILAGGFAREIVKLLRSKDDDLVRHACSLLTNLTKTPDFRSTIYRGSAKASLLELIQRNSTASSVASLPEADKYRAPKIVSQACQVLGNLAIDNSNRADLLRGEETQHDADGNYAIPVLVRALADLVFKEDYLATFSKKSSKERQELDEVRASALFALKNLSISAPPAGAMSTVSNGGGGSSSGANVVEYKQPRISVKSALGRYASKPFLKILRDRDVKDRNLIDYLLRLLYSLCYEPKVAIKLHAERIADGLAIRKQDFANLCLQIQTKISNQQKTSSSQVTLNGGAEDEPQTDVFNAFQPPQAQQQPITGGILKQSKYGGGTARRESGGQE